eukprot:8894739-Prorocentrum_lima.AAC.1
MSGLVLQAIHIRAPKIELKLCYNPCSYLMLEGFLDMVTICLLLENDSGSPGYFVACSAWMH